MRPTCARQPRIWSVAPVSRSEWTNRKEDICSRQTSCSRRAVRESSSSRRGADFVGGMLGLALGEALTPEYKERYFTYHDEGLYASVLSQVEMDAQDCIGRRFAPGAAYDRTESLREAYKALRIGKFLGCLT